MAKSSYSERDYAFGQIMLTLRTAIGLTQGGLAEQLGVSRRAVSEWEAGSSYPKAERLKHFILLAIKHRAFSADHEAEEIRALWKAAHQKVLFDDQWLSQWLYQRQALQHYGAAAPDEENNAAGGIIPLPSETNVTEEVSPASSTGPRVDWNDALTIPSFYGREQELALLMKGVVQDHCRVVSLLGMGGIGKSSLAIKFMHQVAPHFEVVFFRSLRDAPSCDMLLDDCLQALSPQLLGSIPASLEQRISLLIDYLRKVRALVVLDNLETLLEEGDIKGRFRPGFEGYGILLRRVSDIEHQSCFLLTSREKPGELRAAEGKFSPVRSIRLSGLDQESCEQLFAEKEAIGSSRDQQRLARACAGNPLALKIVSETITGLFGGDINQFLLEGTTIFGNIVSLLAEQLGRLAPPEQMVVRWLAVTREPVTIDELLAMLATPLSRVQIFEAIDSLRRRSLIERGQRPASFTLQSVVLEYVTQTLITEMVGDIRQQRPDHLIEYGLEQAGAKEYIRQAQRRLFVEPILAQLHNIFLERGEVEKQILSLLSQLRERADYAQGYGPANLIALLRTLLGHLRGLDFSQLVIREASLQGVEMQDTSLAGATLCNTVFTEAVGSIWAVVSSRTGYYWAAGSRRGDVTIWGEKKKRLYLVWQAHNDNISALAFSPDERTLATGSWDGTVKLWDLQSGALIWTGWHTGLIHGIAFSSDGLTLASAGDDGVVRFWDVASGRDIYVLPHPGPVSAIAWSSDGHLLASSTFDGSIRLWQLQGVEMATCIKVLTGHTDWVFTLAFAPDSSILASGSWDFTVKLWDVASCVLFQTLTGHTDRVHCLAWSPDGQVLASAGHDKTIRLWDVAHKQSRAVLHGHTAVVYTLAFTPDSSLFSGGEDGILRVWDVTSGQCLQILEGYAVFLYDMAWSPDGRFLASAGTGARVMVWDVRARRPPTVLSGHCWTVDGVAWSPDGQYLASSGWDNAIRIWQPHTGICLHRLQDPDEVNTIFQGIAWSPDGSLLASGSYMQGVQVWDMHTYTRRWVGRQHYTRIRRVAWNPAGTRLASCGDDGSICLWNASDGVLLERLRGHNGCVIDIAWSADGSLLASGGGSQGGGDVLVWDTASGKMIQELRGLPGSVFSVVWSPGGETVIAGDCDGNMYWWEMQRSECLMTRMEHRGAVQTLRVSSGGRVLASSGDDGAIRLWDVKSAQLLQTLCLDRPYERLDITNARGVAMAQKNTLQALGAIENDI